MKNKSILLILFFFILANCGFEPIYSSKKSYFNIGEIKITNKNRFNTNEYDFVHAGCVIIK